MNEAHLKHLELRRAAFYRAVQFVSAVPLNAFLLFTLNNEMLLGARNQLKPAGFVAIGFFALAGLAGFFLAGRKRLAGFWCYALAYFSMIPWCVASFSSDWVMSLVCIIINASIGITLVVTTCRRMRPEGIALVQQPDVFGIWSSALLWLNSMAVLTSVLEAGYRMAPSPIAIALSYLLIYGSLVISCVQEFRRHPPSLRRGPHIEWAVLIVILAVIVPLWDKDPSFLLALGAFRQLIVLVRHFLRTRYAWHLNRYFFRRPAQLTCMSFLAVIIIGTLWLSFPVMTTSGKIDVVDALFTTVSAVCVTGLVVVDTATAFTPVGQTVILILIQMGGLGIMTLSTFAAVIMGKNIGLGQEYSLGRMLGDSSVSNVVRLIKFICISTMFVEIAGAATLFPQFWHLRAAADSWRTIAGKAFFHSISAFNNAGFALQSDNLVPFRNRPGILITISLLIVLGGLGFGVLHLLWQRINGERVRLGFHVGTVLGGTMVLLVGGTIIYFFTERNYAFSCLDTTTDQVVNAWFQSVTPRTAGFNTVDMEALRPVSRFFTMILMFIGVAPGSTGGGIKITTVVVMLLAIRAVMRGEDEVRGFGYSLDTVTVFRAGAILTLCITSCIVCVLLLLATQQTGPGGFTTEQLMFESFSAFGTVGLSMNVSPELNSFGKLAVSALMYIGRVGALTLVLSLQPMGRQEIRYPRADVMVG